jgi:hypothetical protein
MYTPKNVSVAEKRNARQMFSEYAIQKQENSKSKAKKNPSSDVISRRKGASLTTQESYNKMITCAVLKPPILDSIFPIDGGLILEFTLFGSNITDVEYSIDNGLTWTSSGSTTLSILVGELTNGTSYPVAVRSKTSTGTSPSSNIISATPNPYIRTFSTVGTTSWTAPQGITSVEYLIVGGGGGSGGGFDTGGGGGGGGGMVLTGTTSVTPGNVYTITVGDGGAGGISLRSPVSETNGDAGENSVFGVLTALGGGGGYASRQGGSSSAGGIRVISPSASVGGSGGGSVGDGNGAGGGGGGSSGDGNAGVSNTGGNGGDGSTSSISLSTVTYGVGGRGANGNVTDGNTGVAGTANTGNGARGGGTSSFAQTNGAKGGSGIVIIRF